jgi:hypothetical protein
MLKAHRRRLHLTPVNQRNIKREAIDETQQMVHTKVKYKQTKMRQQMDSVEGTFIA